MTIRIKTIGTGRFKGHETSVSSYEYSEGSMPHDAFDQSGEVGELSFRADDDDGGRSILLYRDGVELEDNFYGSITGRVNSFNYSDGFVDITGTSRLNLINTEAVVAAEDTTIPQYLRSILAAASITSDVIIAPNVPRTPILTPAYEGNLWVLLKQFAVFHQLDVSLIGNVVFVRPMREREIGIDSVVNEILTLTEDTLVQKFEVAYYNYEQRNDSLAYPIGGWTPDVEVYSVEANETLEFDIPVEAFLEEIKQPVVQSFVAKDYSGPDSVYAVTANDGLLLSPQLWTDFGGNMSFELADLGRVIRVTLTGPDLEQFSPFSISVSDGATEYSTLRIVGTGVFFDRQTVIVPTGLTANDTPQEFGEEIDNVFISTRQEAYDAGVRARRRYALPRQVFDTTGRRLQKSLSVGGDILFFPTFQQYGDTLPPGYDFADFNSSYEDSRFIDFQQSIAEIITQSFGTVAGSRVRFQDAYYRVRNTNVSPGEVSANAEFDTLFKDLNIFQGLSFQDATLLFFGLTFSDYALIPLRDRQYFDGNYFILDQSRLDIDFLAPI